MTLHRLPADSLLISPQSFPVLIYAIEVTQAARRRDGLSPLKSLEALRVAMQPTIPAPAGHEDSEPAAGRETGYISTTEAAETLGVSRRTATRMAPGLGGRLIGGRWAIDRFALEEHVDGQGGQQHE